MIISLFFSATLYQTSDRELERGLRRPTATFNAVSGPGFSNVLRQQILSEREEQYKEAHDRLLNNLILTNLLILVGGGALSYYLALRTLKPIEEAHEAQSRFTADASHELRTPITTMRTENEVALMDPKLTLKEAKQQLKSNVEELEKLSALSDGLLRLAQVENNNLRRVPIKAGRVTEMAVNRVLPRAESRSILINTEIQKAGEFMGDEASVVEALVTLIDNAVKYSPEKSEIIVRVTREQRNILFQVIDSGRGISKSELPHIFDRFYRADLSRTKQNISGYGLGLAIAKSIADAHHGDITVTSKVNKGSTFTLILPAKTGN